MEELNCFIEIMKMFVYCTNMNPKLMTSKKIKERKLVRKERGGEKLVRKEEKGRRKGSREGMNRKELVWNERKEKLVKEGKGKREGSKDRKGRRAARKA